MPTNNEIRAIANNSTYPSTSSRTKTITIQTIDASNIIDLANNLRGEDALEDLSILLSDPDDEQLKAITLESILRFYGNARVLTRVINDCIRIGWSW